MTRVASACPSATSGIGDACCMLVGSTACAAPTADSTSSVAMLDRDTCITSPQAMFERPDRWTFCCGHGVLARARTFLTAGLFCRWDFSQRQDFYDTAPRACFPLLPTVLRISRAAASYQMPWEKMPTLRLSMIAASYSAAGDLLGQIAERLNGFPGLQMTNTLSRRSFLLQAAVASTAGLTCAAAAAPKVRIRHPHTPAGAAGTFWIGGDLQVNRIGLGTTEFTSTRGVVAADPTALRALLRRAVELGVNHIDCADVYGSGLVDGLCERFIYDALYPYPPDLIIATKGGQIRGAPGPHFQIVNGSPEHLRAACEASLKRLKLEQIPLYYMHQPDPQVPYEDSIGALAMLQKAGKIRHI